MNNLEKRIKALETEFKYLDGDVEYIKEYLRNNFNDFGRMYFPKDYTGIDAQLEVITNISCDAFSKLEKLIRWGLLDRDFEDRVEVRVVEDRDMDSLADELLEMIYDMSVDIYVEKENKPIKKQLKSIKLNKPVKQVVKEGKGIIRGVKDGVTGGLKKVNGTKKNSVKKGR